MKRVALRGLAARPVRTALTMLAIVLGVAMVSGAFTLTDTMRGAAQSLSSSAYDGTDAVVSTRTAFNVEATDWTAKRPPIDASVLAKVRAVPGVAVAVGDITDVDTKIIGRNGKPVGDGPYFGSGYDSQVKGASATTPYRLDSGRWPSGPGEVVIDAATAEKEHYALGSSVRVTTPGAAKAYTVVGTTRFGEVKALGTATIAVFDLKTAQTLFHKDGAYDSILVAGRDGVPAADVRKAVSQAVGSTAQVQTAKAHDRFTLEGLEQFISIIRTVLLVFGFVAIFVGAFTIFNTLSITVAQRSHEFGLLRMVGAMRRQVLGSVLLEALAIGLLASTVGLAAGFGIAKGLDAIFDSMDIALPDAGMVFASRTVIVSMLVGTLVTLIAGLIPAWRATRVPPVAALRAADPGAHKVRLLARGVRGMASLIGRPAEKLGGSAGALARRNAMRHPGRTATTASALMIGVALVTLVTVIAQGLRDTTSGTLDKRIAATHVITGADGWSPTDPAVASAVSKAPGITGVTAIRQDVGLAFGDKEVVNSVDPATAPGKFSFEYASGSDDAVASLGRDGAIVDEGLATEQHLTVGDRFSVTSAKGDKLALTVKAIEKSPVLDALGMGPITIAQGTFEKAFENQRNTITLVSADSGAALTTALKPYPDAKSLTKSAYIDSVTSDIDSLLAIFYVLLALAVIVSLFGIVNTLVLSTFERTRELGTLRAVGMTRRQIRRMVRHESVITALIGAGLGIALGLGLAAIVTSVFGDEGLTFAVPTGSLVVLTIVAGVAGVLAAIAPARRAARLDVLTALAYE
ncbi:MAG TPA: FtsX-like permease family protein [Solirubrobacteraceae bacterium]|nr:FtsX-like permease family protein [Solirubrobacteraceae bacterium]